jgi:hypothetical protein
MERHVPLVLVAGPLVAVGALPVRAVDLLYATAEDQFAFGRSLIRLRGSQSK